MKNLNNVAGWALPKNCNSGKWLDEKGNALCGFYSSIIKSRKLKKVCFFDNGRRVSIYAFPDVVIPFYSKSHRWENLFYMGGYGSNYLDGDKTDANRIQLKDTILGLKPVSTIVTHQNEVLEFAKQVTGKLDFDILPHFWEGYKDLCISQPGKVGDLYDLDDLIESYDILFETCGFDLLVDEEKDIIKSWNNLELKVFYESDYANPNTRIDCILSGFILGYPLESTFAFMFNWRE